MRYARAPGILLPIGCKLAKVCGNVDGDAVESGERKIETSVSFGMKAQGPAASSLLKRFPDHGEIIVKLYAENEDFRELCDHFAECLDVLTNLKSSEKSEPRRIDEYETLTNELAEEIQRILVAAA